MRIVTPIVAKQSVLRLLLFGTASLEGETGRVTGRAVHGRRMALLAVLAVARGRSVTRDKLVALLLPESTPQRARHQLSDDIYIVRSGLGETSLRSVGDELALNPDALTSDADEFERMLAVGDTEGAAALYSGPLMDGFHLAESAEFQRWLDVERARVAERYARALEALAAAADRRGDHPEAVHWWRKAAAQDPYSGRVALRLMQALAAGGERASAIRHARMHATLLREELDATPDPGVIAYAERLRLAPEPRNSRELRGGSPFVRPSNRRRGFLSPFTPLP